MVNRARTPACFTGSTAADELMFRRMVERGATSGRADDNETTARKRIANHHNKSVPTIEYYLERGCLCTLRGNGGLGIGLQTNIHILPAMMSQKKCERSKTHLH